MKIRIGTRKSKLALWQSEWVKEQIEKKFPEVEVELIKITTKGDKILDVPLAKIGDKGLFTKEIEDAMLKGEVDIAVHSLKDVPSKLPEGLKLIAFSDREDPRDALLSCGKYTLDTLPEGAVVGTSSLRRKAQLRILRPDLEIRDLRGNVDTRIRKLKEEQYDAIILAAAGVKRLGWENEIDEILSSDKMIPSVSQGILGIEGREDDPEIERIVKEAINSRESEIAATVERAFLRTVEGGCQVPLGCYAVVVENRVHVRAFISDLNGRFYYKEEGVFKVENLEEADMVGTGVAERLLSAGGKKILDELMKCQ
ncbi:Porphobilinogen deaminase [Desulfurobacterium thermolithotrophum DSM 11699]|uniref:Porphobilinogen deaminase n=1 Tax=Desulfurobacterium thermolithotrophum (strain DSM 11699 / BSA) TaxID=868864 RepID=F0S2Y2_DESTD|nr:hydroxymethylbilane synthase [Desulfurobacterium thermolithotrophum]ADY73204.1 Porphobilinogen deaminase [Desulfurobacterium thermolithotrophum DSM 11699]